jgi:L-ribulose-5-phosphate 3-epimerase
MKRRQLLRHTAVAAACAALPCATARAAPGLRARLGVTSDEISDDLEVALKFLQSYKLNWVELRRLWGKYVTELSLEECKRARVLMDRHKVRLSVLDTAMYKCDLPGLPSGRKEDYPFDQQAAVLARALERAPILGTRHIRIFAFWRPKDAAAAADAATWKRIVEEVGKSAETARKAGATLLLENVNGANAETSAEAARLLAAIPSRGFGLAWDPNNAFCGKETPFPDGYRALDRKRIHHVHLRDAAWDGERCRWQPVGKGKVDNLGLLRALAKDAFAGTLTLETHYTRPDGNKELATRESLEGLLPLLDRLSA